MAAARKKAPLLLSALLLAALPFPALAAKASAVYTEAYFRPIVEEAYNDARVGGTKTRMETVQGLSALGGWRVNLNMNCAFPDSSNPYSENYNKGLVFNTPAAVANRGNSFDYIFQTQSFTDLQAPWVEKEIAKRRKELQGEFDDVQVTFDRQPGQGYLLTAKYPFGNGVKPNDIQKRLTYFMSKSQFALCDIVTGAWIASGKLWDEYKGEIKGPVSREIFLALNPVFTRDNYETTKTKASGGAWEMQGDGWGETYENYTDRLEASMGMPIPKGFSQEAADAMHAQLMAVGPAPGAQKLDIYWGEGYIWMTSVYSYAGMTGKQIRKTREDFSNDYAKEHFKAVKKVLKKNL